MRYLSTVGILLACTDDATIAVQPTKIVLVYGQSNATGPGLITELADSIARYREAFAAVQYTANVGDDTNPSANAKNYTIAPIGPRIRADNVEAFGIELTLARALDAAQPGQWAVEKFARSNTNLVVQWAPDGTFPNLDATNLYMQMIAHAQAAEVAHSGRIAAAIWIQGESDAIDSSNAAAYGANLVAFAARFHQTFPGVPFLYGKLNATCFEPFTSTLRAQQVAVAGTATFRLVDQDAYPLRADLLHYTAQSLLDLGDKYAVELGAALSFAIPPQSSFRYRFTSTSRQVAFTDTTKVVGDTAVSWLWDFGDGNTSTSQSPTYTYAADGTYNVTLRVTNTAGNSNTSAIEPVIIAATIAGVSRDATATVYFPNTAGEWTSYFAAVGSTMQSPDGLYRAQEASGNMLDSIGTAPLVLANASTYQQAVPGYTRKSINQTDGSAKAFTSTDASLPDISATSFLVLAFCVMPTGSPAATRNIIAVGVGANRASVNIQTSNLPRATSVANTSSGLTSILNNVRPVWLQVNRATQRVYIMTDVSFVEVTWGSSMAGKLLALGAQPSGLGSMAGGYMMVATWFGAKAEVAPSEIRKVTRGFGVFDVTW